MDTTTAGNEWERGRKTINPKQMMTSARQPASANRARGLREGVFNRRDAKSAEIPLPLFSLRSSRLCGS
jgi:hypothetical protein